MENNIDGSLLIDVSVREHAHFRRWNLPARYGFMKQSKQKSRSTDT